MARLSLFGETRMGRDGAASSGGLGTRGVRKRTLEEAVPFSFSKLFTLKETREEGSGGGGRRPGETSLRNVSLAGHLVLPWPLPHPAVTESGPAPVILLSKGRGKVTTLAPKGSSEPACNRGLG